MRQNEIPRRALVYVLSQVSDWDLSDKAVSSIAKAEKPEDFDVRLNLPTDGNKIPPLYFHLTEAESRSKSPKHLFSLFAM